METHERQPEANDHPPRSISPGSLELSPERREFLSPRLAALLADFGKLAALVTSDAEPAMTAELTDEVRRERE